nr:P2Y purinoceptor 8 isoform X1 [Marmota flaviventris]XP_034491255.1 P2Y purinoceptor 8 isoform X1 [Marmota flaviventris]
MRPVSRDPDSAGGPRFDPVQMRNQPESQAGLWDIPSHPGGDPEHLSRAWKRGRWAMCSVLGDPRWKPAQRPSRHAPSTSREKDIEKEQRSFQVLRGLSAKGQAREDERASAAAVMGPVDMNVSGPDNATLQMLRNPAIAVALPVVYSLVVLVSIPGNLFSLWVLCRHIGPKSPSVIFMINLSVTDLMLASVLPFQIYYHCNGHHWVFGEVLCNVVTVAFYANMYCSILTMTCISVERFLGVVHPLSSARWRRRRYALAACAGTWALLLAALFPLARTDLTYEVDALGIVTCFDVLKWTMLPSVAMWALFLFTIFVLLFLIPFVVTVACYTATITKLLRTADGGHDQGQRRRAVCLAAVVLLAFVTCFAPNNFVLLVHMVSRLFFGRSYYHVYKLTLCLSCLNNCLDPFVYYFASREFQLRLRHYLGYGRLPSDSLDTTRRDSLFSARTLSARSMSAGPGDALDGTGRPGLKRQESVF